MGTPRKNPDSIKSILADIRNYGTGDSKYTEKLLFDLTGKKDWTVLQCDHCFEAILHYYIDDEKNLELMLAVSGLLTGYRIIKKVTERREKYLDYLTKTCGETRTDPDSLKKNEEEYCLDHIAKELQKAKDNGEIDNLVKQWTSGINNMRKKSIDIQDIIQSEASSTDKNPVYIIINGGIRDSNINLGDNKVGQQKASDRNSGSLHGPKAKELRKTVPVGGWGPKRPTYTMSTRPKHATFNSITDNSKLGDERDFVRIVEKGSGNTFTSDLEIESNKEYIISIFYHNNASPTYNDAAHNYAGVARDTRVISYFPEKLAAGETGGIDGAITSSNADPQTVWDGVRITAKENLIIEYVEGTAKIYNSWGVNKTELSKKFFTAEGVFIGLNELNGLILGGGEYCGMIYYNIRTIADENPIP